MIEIHKLSVVNDLCKQTCNKSNDNSKIVNYNFLSIFFIKCNKIQPQKIILIS